MFFFWNNKGDEHILIFCFFILFCMEQKKKSFARLLLGEDMTGSGKGGSSALALSNALRQI